MSGQKWSFPRVSCKDRKPRKGRATRHFSRVTDFVKSAQFGFPRSGCVASFRSASEFSSLILFAENRPTRVLAAFVDRDAHLRRAGVGDVGCRRGDGWRRYCRGSPSSGCNKTVAAVVRGRRAVTLSMTLRFCSRTRDLRILKKTLKHLGVIIGTGIPIDVGRQEAVCSISSGLWIVRLTGGQRNRVFLTLCVVDVFVRQVLTIVPAMLILCSLVLVICRLARIQTDAAVVSVAICRKTAVRSRRFASGLPNI